MSIPACLISACVMILWTVVCLSVTQCLFLIKDSISLRPQSTATAALNIEQIKHSVNEYLERPLTSWFIFVTECIALGNVYISYNLSMSTSVANVSLICWLCVEWVNILKWGPGKELNTQRWFIITLRTQQNGRHFADDIYKSMILNGNCRILILNSLKYAHKGPVNNKPALVQIRAWRPPGDKPLSEPMVNSFSGVYKHHSGSIIKQALYISCFSPFQSSFNSNLLRSSLRTTLVICMYIRLLPWLKT